MPKSGSPAQPEIYCLLWRLRARNSIYTATPRLLTFFQEPNAALFGNCGQWRFQMDFSREEAFYYCLQPLDFVAISAHCFGRNLPVTPPFFLPALMWFIFRVFGYFWFFRLFLVPPMRWISVVKTHSIFATFFAYNRSISRRFLPIVLAEIYPSRCPSFLRP